MGKSSPTKLQLKHIPDSVVLETVFHIQNQWTVWVGARGDLAEGIHDPYSRMRKLSYQKKKYAILYEICEVLKPIPEKLIWRKLQDMERRDLIYSIGPASIRYRVVE